VLVIRVAAAFVLMLGSVAAAGGVPGLGTFTYDGVGNITAIGEQTFFYDTFGRLKKAFLAPGSSREYVYDRYGNLVEIVTNGVPTATLKLAVDSRTNRIDNETTAATHVDATHDAGGNIVATELGDVFVYDGINMVKEWKVGDSRKLYVYSASDERLATVTLVDDVQQRTDWTVRDPVGQVLRRFSSLPSGTWTWEEDYIYRNGQLLAAEIPGSAKTLQFHLDHLGTPRLITGNGGAQIAQHTYDPFGSELTPAAHMAEPMRFTGHERDGAALDYMHARYYTPRWGRFLSIDPVVDPAKNVAEPQRWNRYAYVTNNPIRYVDPDGRERAQIWLDQDVRDFASGAISQRDYLERIQSRGVTAIGAAGAVASAAYAPVAVQAAGYFWLTNKTSILLGAMGWGAAMTGGPVPVQTGKIGEQLAGIAASKLRVAIPGTLRTRIPDELTATVLREIKNVAYQARTMQLRDFLAYAQSAGVTFILEVRQNTVLSKPLQQLVDAGLIELKRTLPAQ
jgi:RHS repeat-associated protein